MDRRMYDMLEMNKRSDREDSQTIKNCFNDNFCLKTNYESNNDGILTMAFVNMQPLDSVYETDEGFCHGTIYPNLDKPFYGGSIR